MTHGKKDFFVRLYNILIFVLYEWKSDRPETFEADKIASFSKKKNAYSHFQILISPISVVDNPSDQSKETHLKHVLQ